MRRTLVTLAVVSLFAACGFPGIEYENAGSDDGGEDAKADGTTGADGASDASDAGDSTSSEMNDAGDGEASAVADATGDSSDSSTGAETGTDGPLGDAPVDSSAADSPIDVIEEQPVDSGADVHDTGVDAPVCDFDLDTYKAEGGTCLGNDCCDTDSLAHPGQTLYYTTADKCLSFDYNCNGTLDPEYPVNLKCGGTGITGCTGGSGFIGNPACGTSALYGTCVPNGALACQAGSEMPVVQGCH
jgi:hypothetical protein